MKGCGRLGHRSGYVVASRTSGACAGASGGLRDQPQAIHLDTGPEFLAERFISWCAEWGIELRYIQPGELDQKAFIEHYDGTVEQKCSMPMCVSQWIRCERSPQNGCRATTKSGPRTHWQVSHPPRIGLDLKPEVLLSKWLLDGGAYDTSTVPYC